MVIIKVGDMVTLRPDEDCIVPAGDHIVSKVDPAGEPLHVGGNTAIWRCRIIAINGVIYDQTS